jgi:ferredoxin-NADP reductase
VTVETVARRPLPPLRPLPAPGLTSGPGSPLGDNAVITAREDLSHSVARFRIRPDDPPPHVEPGQYLALGLLVDGRIVQRPYSTATRAGAHEELEFLVRLVPGGTFTPLLWNLAVGDRLHIGRPKGLFSRPPGDVRTHVFIATGTGLAPFVAMIETMLREPAPPEALMIHGVAHVEELAYRERFERWQADGLVTYVPSISRPDDPSNAGWTGRTGRIHAILDDVWAARDLAPNDTVAYLCGNPEMIVAGERILAARGLPDDAIRSEHYWPASSS